MSNRRKTTGLPMVWMAPLRLDEPRRETRRRRKARRRAEGVAALRVRWDGRLGRAS